jgi:hypothetical protein
MAIELSADVRRLEDSLSRLALPSVNPIRCDTHWSNAITTLTVGRLAFGIRAKRFLRPNAQVLLQFASHTHSPFRVFRPFRGHCR